MDSDREVPSCDASALWPGRVRELAGRWSQPMDPGSRDVALAELWKLLNVALHRYIRAQARRFGGLDDSDAADIAADKALDLLGRIESRQWKPGADSNAQVCAYLATVARNGVIDFARRRGREIPAGTAETLTAGRTSAGAGWPEGKPHGPDAEGAVDGRRYARAIVACAGRLAARARLAWFLRAFCDLTSAEIARHPGILTSAGGVDVMLNRARRQIRRCMESSGFESSPIPPGAFMALWEMIDAERRTLAPRAAADEERG